jgi:hypothetical protein
LQAYGKIQNASHNTHIIIFMAATIYMRKNQKVKAKNI